MRRSRLLFLLIVLPLTLDASAGAERDPKSTLARLHVEVDQASTRDLLSAASPELKQIKTWLSEADRRLAADDDEAVARLLLRCRGQLGLAKTLIALSRIEARVARIEVAVVEEEAAVARLRKRVAARKDHLNALRKMK